MFRKVLNAIFSSKAFYILVAVLCSVALWMFVEINENQYVTVNIKDIEVEYINEELLRDKNLVIAAKTPETVALSFECPRSLMSKLTNQTVRVTVDLSGIRSTGAFPIRHNIVYPASVDAKLLTVTSQSVDSIMLRVDKLSNKQVQVKGVYSGGTSSEEYIADEPVFEPQTITVYGPEALVSRVSHVYVPILRENLSSTINDDMEFILMDNNDEEIDDETLNLLDLSQDTVRVTVPVRMIKEVALKVDFLYSAGAVEANTLYTIEPQFITVSGDPAILKEYNNILLGTIDLSRFELNGMQQFPIMIENGLINNSGETQALVTFEMQGLEMNYLSVSNLFAINEPAGYTVDIISQYIDVRLRGKPEDVYRVEPINIRVVADVKDLGSGFARIQARVYIDGDFGDVGATGTHMISVNLDRIQT